MTRTGKREFLTGAAIGIAVVLFVMFVISPALAVQGIIGAARAGDAAGLERRVDFPAFRESLKDELNARMRAEIRADLSDEDDGLRALGMLLAPSLMDSAVDAFVTPQAIAAMVESAEAPGTDDSPAAASVDSEDGDLRRSYGYRGLNTFVVTLTDPDRPDQPLDLLLQRRGLFAFQLAGVELPDRPQDPPAA